MRIPTWRLALTGGAIVILLIAGVGLVAASTSHGTIPANVAAAAPAASPDGAQSNGRLGLRQRIAAILGGRVGPVARHFVDGRLTFTDRTGALVTIQLDHGTIASIGSGSITISEAGGATVTLSTDTTTIVRLGGGAGIGQLSDLKVGDEVFVESRVDGATTLAKHILRVPQGTAAPAPSATTGG